MDAATLISRALAYSLMRLLHRGKAPRKPGRFGSGFWFPVLDLTHPAFATVAVSARGAIRLRATLYFPPA